LRAQPADEIEAGFAGHAQVRDDRIGHRIFAAVEKEAGALEIGLGLAGVSTNKRLRVLERRESLEDHESVFRAVFDNKNVHRESLAKAP
jgi:hypothetical protein